MTLRGLNLTVRGDFKGGFSVADKDKVVLGRIDCRQLGTKLPLFCPSSHTVTEGLSSDFLLEIGIAMTVVSREGMDADYQKALRRYRVTKR